MSGEGTATERPTEYVTLVSAEGYEFVLDKQAASRAKMLKAMMSGSETLGREIRRFPFDDISAPVLDLICQYLAERHRAGSSMSEFPQLNTLQASSQEDWQIVCLPPPPPRHMLSPHLLTQAMELLLASDYLGC